MSPIALVLFLVIVSVVSPAGGGELTPFVIPVDPDPNAAVAFASAPIEPDGPRITVRDGHFVRQGRRYRVWGVNLCFGANFPTHDNAERLARRLASAGINSVRFHHMDMAAFPRGIWDPDDPMKLSAEALDRLDYLIDRLARRGISANLNLHVSRSHARVLNLPDADQLPNFDKIADLFTPRLIAAQKRYARDLLTHVNRYRGVRYADDPAVAFVEITNEDSFFMWGGDRKIQSLPPYYRGILRRMYNDWLGERYATGEQLRAAWGVIDTAPGTEMLADPNLTELAKRGPTGGPWVLEQHAGSTADLRAAGSAVRIDPTPAGEARWHVQLTHPGLKLSAGGVYTLSLTARAAQERTIDVYVSQAHRPWRQLGISRTLRLTDRWQTFELAFQVESDEPNARVALAVGGADPAVDLRRMSLRPGGRLGLDATESLARGTIRLYADSPSPARSTDRLQFLAETEKAYFDDMRRFLRDQLGCRSLITGTIVFGPLGLWAQSDMDWIDTHAYWQHPRFPGRPWDRANWRVGRKAMVDSLPDSPLVNLAASRLAGKPFTVSEYNHPAPNDFQVECVPLVAAMGAAQDWDGIWLFAYSHRTDDFARASFTSFFDIDANPCKWGFVPAGTVIFRQAGLGRLAPGPILPLTTGRDVLSELARLHLHAGLNLAGALERSAGWQRGQALERQTRLALTPRAQTLPAGTATAAVRYRRDGPGHASLQFDGRGTRVWVGGAREPSQTGPAELNITAPGFAAVTLTALDGRPLNDSARLLVTACGRCENTGMRFNADRTSVGTRWGRAPVRIEPVAGQLPLPAGAWSASVLGPSGGVKGPAVVSPGPRSPMLNLRTEHGTMWYLLTRNGG